MPHTVLRPLDYTIIHKKRRKVLNNLRYDPLPKRNRPWKDCTSENCAICKEGAGDDEISPRFRLTCFGTYQCDHVFHQKCIQDWLQRSRTCPVCRSAGNTVGAIEEKDDTSRQLVSSKLENTSIPWIHAFHGFFHLAKFKINLINFIKIDRSYSMELDICQKKNCQSKKCSHAISNEMEMLEWVRQCPDEYARKKSPEYIAKKLLLPALMEFAPHIFEHLSDLALEDKYRPVYQYTLITQSN